jgi:drug/metabolite transporter (DMT)-like permease
MNLLAAAYAVRLALALSLSLSLSLSLCPSLSLHTSRFKYVLIVKVLISVIFHFQGIVSSSIAYYVQGLVMQKRGPVFVTAFSPLMMIIVAIMGSFILAENIYVGG